MSESIAVVGAGICGMCTALALSQSGFKVSVFERDVPPPEGNPDQAFFEWTRRGAAQFRHPHAFLGLMCSVLEEKYPDEFNKMRNFWTEETQVSANEKDIIYNCSDEDGHHHRKEIEGGGGKTKLVCKYPGEKCFTHVRHTTVMPYRLVP